MSRFLANILSAVLLISSISYAKESTAIFAGGCFWSMEADFDKLPGVVATVVGFDGGKALFPTYAQVSAGKTNYAESVKVLFDSDVLTYRSLVEYFFKHIDPVAADGQFCDKGRQYRSAIFYLNKEQQKIASDVKKQVLKKFDQVYTEIIPSTQFYPAEDYHQAYYKKNPWRYRYYQYRCGRDERIEELWRTLSK